MAKLPKTNKKFEAASYPYPQCREQHIWRSADATLDTNSKVGYRIQQCENCPTKKFSQMSLLKSDQGMFIRHARYQYPADYHVKGGLDAREKGQLRALNFLDEVKNKGKG